jgi:hypothetical protein
MRFFEPSPAFKQSIAENHPANETKNKTLLVPSVCLGNLGQMVVDLLAYNLPDCVYCGAFDPRYVLPLTGSSAFHSSARSKEGPAGAPLISMPLELYFVPSSNAYILQQRSPFFPVCLPHLKQHRVNTLNNLGNGQAILCQIDSVFG